ncbi:cryptochrome/photolyase family protein [Halalkalirubrum salinum]|uniref:cryptochrome/photolyase family protein n=1 Tax=Halalkalirubrum salinum TaxID=2563889 RepID=UPI0010FAE581|nr:deoxyribodipyrimidine photo-lyase [Halalkalirubrum salinum]
MQLFWHRRDLRTADNRGLAAATRSGEVAPVFVFDTGVLEHGSSPRVAFMLDALASLRDRYRRAGSDLLIRHGDPATVLPTLASELDADSVVWNQEYSGLGRDRDERVRTACEAASLSVETSHDAIHHEPGSITTNAGDIYSVFTYFGRKWHDREKADPYPEPAPDALASAEAEPLAAVETEPVPTLSALGFSEPEATIQPAGTDAARERAATFCGDGIFRYGEDRDYPDRGATSRLSADLKFGTIGIRELYAATERAAAKATGDEAESVEEFQSQLAWREFYTHVLWDNPEVVSQNYKSYEQPIEWREDPEALQAWKDGKTGYPIVDAGMRQLREEAYMHNRVRMIVASFLTKDLLVDWRAGYAWFREKLVDHDTANDNGGWQWAASTGTDAQPYFRIFNPMTQGERYDPDAAYIKRYVPELADTDPVIIHSWHDASPTQRYNAAPEYPEPIVDHSERREAAIAMFEAARGDD